MMATAPTSTEGKTSMTVRLDRATLDAFDALAEGRGGRSALLRSLLDQAMRQAGDAPKVQARAEPATSRVSFRVTDAELAVLDTRAAERGTDRAGWVKALMRRHIGLKGNVDDGLRESLGPVRMQLQRIGRNLNQAMRAGNAAMMADSGLQIERELRRITEMRQDINEQIAALGEALRGDLSYWEVAD
jgi:hypothetical protein